ncbi:MAG: hypothetical protein LC740_13495, partial [Actinobacteria bacterium]|nr:hypothetical protein [Actinomycetota bacterium]
MEEQYQREGEHPREGPVEEGAAGSPEDAPADAPVVDDDPTREIVVGEVSEESSNERVERDGADAEVTEPEELRRRIEAKDRYARELHEELAAVRLATDEARARL